VGCLCNKCNSGKNERIHEMDEINLNKENEGDTKISKM
jgi:hypothetical protein